MIHDAISRNLAGKGLNKVGSGGDVIVAYLVIVGNNAVTESINTTLVMAAMPANCTTRRRRPTATARRLITSRPARCWWTSLMRNLQAAQTGLRHATLAAQPVGGSAGAKYSRGRGRSAQRCAHHSLITDY